MPLLLNSESLCRSFLISSQPKTFAGGGGGSIQPQDTVLIRDRPAEVRLIFFLLILRPCLAPFSQSGATQDFSLSRSLSLRAPITSTPSPLCPCINPNGSAPVITPSCGFAPPPPPCALLKSRFSLKVASLFLLQPELFPISPNWSVKSSFIAKLCEVPSDLCADCGQSRNYTPL